MIEKLQQLMETLVAKREERGASAVEYGLLIAGIAALIVAIVFIFGGALNGIFKDTCDSVTASATTKCTN